MSGRLPRERDRSWGLFLFCFSLLFSTFISSVGYFQFQAEKKNIARSLQKALQNTDKKLAETLFIAGLEEGIEKAMLAIQKADKESPYLPQVPSVAEVLTWLSSHPLVEAMRYGNDPLNLLNIKYELVSFPHIGAMTKPYRGKIEIEFQVKSPMNARKFHESLLQSNAMVDPNEEVTWEALLNSYRVSFYLKNRVFYVR